MKGVVSKFWLYQSLDADISSNQTYVRHSRRSSIKPNDPEKYYRGSDAAMQAHLSSLNWIYQNLPELSLVRSAYDKYSLSGDLDAFQITELELSSHGEDPPTFLGRCSQGDKLVASTCPIDFTCDICSAKIESACTYRCMKHNFNACIVCYRDIVSSSSTRHELSESQILVFSWK